MVTLTIRCADGTPIRIPLDKLQILSVLINETPVWEKPEELKPGISTLTAVKGVNTEV